MIQLYSREEIFEMSHSEFRISDQKLFKGVNIMSSYMYYKMQSGLIAY